MFTAVPIEHPLEVTEVLGDALLYEDAAAPASFALLIFIVEAARDGMVRVVRLGNEVGDGEL